MLPEIDFDAASSTFTLVVREEVELVSDLPGRADQADTERVITVRRGSGRDRRYYVSRADRRADGSLYFWHWNEANSLREAALFAEDLQKTAADYDREIAALPA